MALFHCFGTPIVGFTLGAKLASSKPLIKRHLKILTRPVQNMASTLVDKLKNITGTLEPLHVHIVHMASTSQGAKKVIFTACHSGKLKLTFTSPNIISQFFYNLKFFTKLHLPVGQVKNRIY